MYLYTICMENRVEDTMSRRVPCGREPFFEELQRENISNDSDGYAFINDIF